MDNTSKSIETTRSNSKRMTAVACGIGAFLVVICVAALIIVPGIYTNEMEKEAAELQKRNDELRQSVIGKIDSQLENYGQIKDNFEQSQLEQLYNDCIDKEILARDILYNTGASDENNKNKNLEERINRLNRENSTIENALDSPTLCRATISNFIMKNGASQNESKIIAPSAENGYVGDHVYGNPSAKVVIIEYADYQCPACASWNRILSSVLPKYKDDIAFVYRNYPLSYHQNANAAAHAAEAAGELGYYWEMHDALYERRNEWINESDPYEAFLEIFEDVATAKDASNFYGYYHSSEYKWQRKIEFDKKLGNEAKIAGTPAIFINGQQYDSGSISTADGIIENLSSKIEQAIENYE